MDPNLYTDEFRNFKFLKSSPEHVHYFKIAKIAANFIQPRDDEKKEDFSWPNRLDFIEQLLDLRYDSVYIVVGGELTRNHYDDSSVLELFNPIVLTQNPIIYDASRIATLEDIPVLEDAMIPHACLCEARDFDDPKDPSTFNGTGRVIRLETLPIVPHAKSDFTELFNNRDTAIKYKNALNSFIRNKLNAMSALSARL